MKPARLGLSTKLGARARAGFTFQTIDVPGAGSTTAFGINGRGQIVGFYVDSSGGNHGFLDSGGNSGRDALGGAGRRPADSPGVLPGSRSSLPTGTAGPGGRPTADGR